MVLFCTCEFYLLFVWFMCFMCVWCVYYVFYVYMGQVPEIKLMMMMMMMIGNCQSMGCDSGVGWCHQDNLLAVAVRSAASLRDYCQ